MAIGLRRYRTGLTDSTWWDAVVLREDDIVISTPSKCGTTWLQMLCALLVFQGPDLPRPLTELSPWVDMRLRPVDELVRRLDAQDHRRFLKTHTPLDGLPSRAGVTYVVAGRDLRDVAVSMSHHRANINGDVVEGAKRTMARFPDVGDRIHGWLIDDRPPEENLSSMTGTAWHLRGVWDRRDDPSVHLVHHADLTADLERELRRLAAALRVEVPEDRWPSLVAAGTFQHMQRNAAQLVPDERMGILRDSTAFFRSGRSGQWRTELTPADLASYERRASDLLPPDLRAWLER